MLLRDKWIKVKCHRLFTRQFNDQFHWKLKGFWLKSFEFTQVSHSAFVELKESGNNKIGSWSSRDIRYVAKLRTHLHLKILKRQTRFKRNKYLTPRQTLNLWGDKTKKSFQRGDDKFKEKSFKILTNKLLFSYISTMCYITW